MKLATKCRWQGIVSRHTWVLVNAVRFGLFELLL